MVNVLSICDYGDMQPIPGVLTSRGTTRNIRMSPPSKLDLSVHSARVASGLDLIISAPSLDRILVWAARFDEDRPDPREILWTSETEPFPVVLARRGVEVRIPERLMAQCERFHDCEIVVQGAVITSGVAEGVPVVSISESKQMVYGSP
ncbi:MAG TPA: hypothetical protein VK427_03265 [Kofleriaceae bacterium]|nr:hypothetical protein [Kofleriaceae bacterium]